jgi:general secretion pathway protein H
LIVVVIAAVVTGGALYSLSAIHGVRLRRSATMLASAIRVAYSHASATSKVVRLVLDFDRRSVALEQTAGDGMHLRQNDRTGGAVAVTPVEQKAQEEAEKILKGPIAPRPAFRPVKAYGWDPDLDKRGKQGGPVTEKTAKDLADGVRFLQVETGHEDLPNTNDRSYLYFWPGGMTERAAIQLEAIKTGEAMTILIAPLTGKVELKVGRVNMFRPRDESEESERQDGF